VIQPFNAFNEDDEPQLVNADQVWAENPHLGQVKFYVDGILFNLQENEFARFVKPAFSHR